MFHVSLALGSLFICLTSASINDAFAGNVAGLELGEPANAAVKSINGKDYTLGEVVVAPPSFPGDMARFLIPFRITNKEDRTAMTNWTAYGMDVQDAAGRRASSSPVKQISNGWISYRCWGDLDFSTNMKVKAVFVMDSGIARSNLFTLTIPVPLGNKILTNWREFL